MKYTICLDFDGVLHSYRSGYQGKPWIIPDPPVPGALEWLREFYERSELGEVNAIAAIYSTRSKSIRGRLAMKRWLYRWLKHEFGYAGGPTWDPVCLEIPRWVQWPWFKPPALVTVDDRAIRFEGNWDDPELQPDRLLKQRPWFRS